MVLGSSNAEVLSLNVSEFDRRVETASGDTVEFEKLLQEFKPFLRARASQMAGNGGRPEMFDEMANDAFMAFYEAVQAYDRDKGHFFPFMRNVVHRRLIDNMRKTSSNHISTIPLETDDEDVSGEYRQSPINSISVEAFMENSRRNDLAIEIECYERELKEWGITMELLVRHSPKHSKLRNLCREIIDAAASDEEIMRIMWVKHYFPTKKISILTKIHPKIISYVRIFIIGSLIIRAGDYDYLKQYVMNHAQSAR